MKVTTRYCTLLTLLFFVLSHQTFPQTHIQAGNINGKWVKQNSPYYIDGEIKIPHGKKLIVEPGVKIIFTGHYKLIVNGILEAKGKEQDSIYFFPSDTAVGWHGIRFINAEDFSNLEYCVLKNGKTAIADSMSDIIYDRCESDPNCDELDFLGGAVLVFNSNPTIIHCTISDNVACRNGGGIAIVYHSIPKLSYCEITNNISLHDGGGIYCSVNSNPLIDHCSIRKNYSGNMGGGLFLGNYSNALIDICVIERNIAEARGGGISFYTSAKPSLKNSTISGNSGRLGGGIYIDEFYNLFREQPGKIDIRIVNVRIENNTADYGGGIWLRDTQGELSGVTICNNKAMIGGGINIEHNPQYLTFSSVYLCNIYMNFARIMGNDLFRLGGEKPTDIPLDTFTVKYYSALNAEPVEKFPLTIKNFKLTQVNADLYVNPEGDDSNSGLSSDEPLKSLKIALLKLLSDSTSPRTIYMDKGEYIFTETNDILMLDKHKYVSLKGAGFTDVIFGTDRITVFTPWWITTWALIIYVSTLFSVILVFWNVRMRRIRIRSELEKKEFEAQKLHEVDELKTRFFTNISHEFRTPLTLILGPTSDLINEEDDKDKKKKLKMIHKSADRLHELVNQLLDLSKLESGNMNLRTYPQNIIPLLKGLVLSFASFAERKSITLNFNSDKEEIVAYIDKDKVEKIFINLLSNALKFTPEGGRVDVVINCQAELVSASLVNPKIPKQVRNDKNGFVEISIQDTGIGISAERIDKIFDRFYQVDSSHTREQEGTGLGLALTKELIELHKGQISVDSSEGKGSTFTVTLPLGKDHLKPEEIIEGKLETEEVVPKKGELRTEYDVQKVRSDIEVLTDEGLSADKASKLLLLIVEDNADVKEYIKGNIEEEFRILEAVDGEDGLNQAINHIPDLIISDVMMPKMDGFEMCDKLKNDERTSHIPVIMLTAKATSKDKIDGYKTGADDYIMKPFDAQVLRARIYNLIQQRKRLGEHFKKEGIFQIDNANVTSMDKAFLKKALDLIKNHISDDSFSVDVFAEEISMSRYQLRRKLVALVGEAPSDLIRRIRLTKAAKLIEENFGNISEIAAEVGFNNPANFAHSFKTQFGVSPSDYLNSKKV